jgi:copper transport protein
MARSRLRKCSLLRVEQCRSYLRLKADDVSEHSRAVFAEDSDGRPREVVEVTLWVSNPELSVAPLQRPAQRLQTGRWRVPDLVLALPGAWHFEVDVLISDFAGETLEGRFKVEEISTE